jgi:NTE family protein
MSSKAPKIGLALGGGSARGWAHIGVIRELHAMGIEPDIISGTSIGSLVGGAYVSDQLDTLEEWVVNLNKSQIVKLLDISMLTGGGFVEGKRLFDNLKKHIGDTPIEKLPKPYGAVACNLGTGQEIWFQKGSLLEAIRASVALPGLFTPVKRDHTWLVDGGLVNPVPVSLCRAMGAERIIAVNLNGGIVGKHMHKSEESLNLPKIINHEVEQNMLQRWTDELRQRASEVVNHIFDGEDEEPDTPGLLDVMAGSINIMQDRITRSRMAGDPPDVSLTPRLSHIGLMEFDRAEETIEAGQRSVQLNKDAIKELILN